MNARHKIIGITAAAVLVLLGGCKTLQETAASKTFTQPEGVELMSEAELRKTLVGNTYEGESVRYPGSTYVEFVRPDGTIRGLWNGNERYQGEWVISGQVWCFRYKSSNGCNTAAKSGDTIFWYALDGTTRGGKSIVMAGDPKNLNR
jgi:hypothetical protein